MRKVLPNALLFAAFMAPALGASNPNASTPVRVAKPADQRHTLLTRFFERYECPLTHLAADFLAASDRYSLDWRLLPSIAFVESSGGKRFVNNNIFGWDSARAAFASVRDGIHIVASRLGQSKLYRGKDLDGLLSTYNPHPDYPARVKSVMQKVGSGEPRRRLASPQ